MLCRYTYVVQVILCQKHSFLNQLTQNITTDCLLNYEFIPKKLQIQCMLCKLNWFMFWHSEQFVVHNMYWTCSFLVLNLWISKQYFGLIDERVSASDKELPVRRVSIIGRKILYLDNLPRFFSFMDFVRLYQFWMCMYFVFV